MAVHSGSRSSFDESLGTELNRPRPRHMAGSGSAGVARATRVSRHLSASVGVATAGSRALLHDIAGSKPLAVFRAAIANFSANSADAAVHLGIAQHEIRGALAYLSTVEQQGNMLRLRVIAALVQAVGHRLQADAWQSVMICTFGSGW